MVKTVAWFRLMRAGWVLAREGVISSFPAEGLSGLPYNAYRLAGLVARRKSKKANHPERMSRAMNRLGPAYIKLGQFLATRPDIVGCKVASDLSLLQDRVETFPLQAAVTQIENSLGHKKDDCFTGFEDPVAAASMAQVHPAWIRNSDGSTCKVAVKVIRPGLRQAFARDLESFFLAARAAEHHVPSIRRLQPVLVVQNLSRITRLEMDMRLEAAALSEMAENAAADTGFRVPRVIWEYTGRDVLTMEWIDGIKISDREALTAAGHNTRKLAVALMQSFLRHALRDGFFHADMHPGNLFVDKDGNIVAVDFGITGRLGNKEKRFLAEILYGFIHRDYHRVARVHFDAGYVPDFHDIARFAQANRAIGEPIHGKSVETISIARLLSLLFEITELFDMQTRPELLLLQKTMVVVEGVSRSLDPNFNMWKTAEPVVSEWFAKNLGPVGLAKDLVGGGLALAGLARKSAELVNGFDPFAKRSDNISLNAPSLHAKTISLTEKQIRQNQFSCYALWVIALCCLATAFRLFF